ncbi:MAG: hypothetical protein OXQ28_15060, partial [Acidobacteriota bacterium]|nr:hypothetical protein [Acidobacteriota bacterium]
MSGSVNGMVAAVIFQLVSSAGSSGRARGLIAACVVFAFSGLSGTLAHAQIRFSGVGLAINGQAPAVLQEDDADQIINATVSYEVDLGYSDDHALRLKAEPLGSDPATLSAGSPRCTTPVQLATVDLLLEEPTWDSSDGAPTGYVAGSYPKDPEQEDQPPVQRRSFSFTFGTLCADSEIEPTEQFQISLWFENADTRLPPLKHIVRIVDAGRGDTGLDSDFEVTETDVDFVALLALPLEEPPGRVRCYAYRIAYGASTADEAEARLVGSDGRSPVGFG